MGANRAPTFDCWKPSGVSDWRFAEPRADPLCCPLIEPGHGTCPSTRPALKASIRRCRSAALATLPGQLESGPPEPPKPRLLDRVRQALRARHLSRRTEEAYVAWIRRFIVFHDKRHPAEMGAPDVTKFLTSLAIDGQVAASTQNQALSALLFLYKEVLERRSAVARRHRARQAPRAAPRRAHAGRGARRSSSALDGVPRLMAGLLYGAGLRLLECCRLRVKDLDFATNQIVVRGGKGDKDRVTMLPGIATAGLARHLDRVRAQHAARPRRGRRLGRAADRPAPQVPARGARVGLAMGLPRHPHLP